MVENKIIAIIPARGGSKRIPKKNIIELGGKPMIAWTIEAALGSKYISRVVVSTDDVEIASISKKYGAEVPFLRDEKSDNYAPVSLATLRALEQLEQAGISSPDIVVQLMANCPFRDSDNIDKSIENFILGNHDFQISCFKYGWMNPWWAHKIDKKGNASPVFEDEIMGGRSQDQPDLYCPTGAIWIAKTAELKKEQTFYGKGYKLYPLELKSGIDIDDYQDLKMAKYFLNNK